MSILLKITIKAARVNAELTQEQAAEKIGVTVKTIQNWESGATSPTMEQGKKLASVYGLTVDNIIF